MSWENLDLSMQRFKAELIADVKIDPSRSVRLATTISSEVRFLPSHLKQELRLATPVDLNHRLDELRAFQAYMEAMSADLRNGPEYIRAQVIVQNYISFIYLSEACFLVLRKVMPSDSATRKCSKFLTDNPIRSFRNALAHSNWTYSADFSGLVFWARKGGDKDEQLVRHEVKQETLEFWQALSRCTAYAAFSNA